MINSSVQYFIFASLKNSIKSFHCTYCLFLHLHTYVLGLIEMSSGEHPPSRGPAGSQALPASRRCLRAQVSLVVESAMVAVPTEGLKAAATSTSSADGFTYDCTANTPWRPIWCGNAFGGGYYGGWGSGFYFGR
jgi:hypothetical protein